MDELELLIIATIAQGALQVSVCLFPRATREVFGIPDQWRTFEIHVLIATLAIFGLWVIQIFF